MKILYVDMDNVLVDFKAGVKALDEDIAKAYAGRLDEIPGFFADLPPIEGALEAFNEIRRHFDTYILSTAPWENPSAWTDKLLWVKKHLNLQAHKRLILTHYKNLNHGDFLIDDRPNNGADKFTGELIRFGSAVFPDWETVMEYLLERK